MVNQRNRKWVARAALAFVAVAGSGLAMAQSSAGSWETKFGLTYNGSWDSGSNDSTASVDSELGFSLGAAYHLSSKLSFGGAFEFDQPDYNASLVSPNFPNQTFNIRGDLENMRLLFDATYEFLDTGAFRPYASALAGWTWTDTNIATSPPETGCWWDPWWGPICTTWQDTKSIDGFTYGLAVGGRYDFNRSFAMQLGYRYLWTDYGRAVGTPDMDGFTLSLNWAF